MKVYGEQLKVHEEARVLIIEGSASPPAFVRNLILGLASHPLIRVAVLTKKAAIKSLSGVPILASDFERFTSVRIVSWLAVEFVRRPGRMLEAMRLTTPARTSREWLKRWYRTGLILSFEPSILHFQWATHIDAYSRLILARRFKCVVSLRGSQINIRPIVDLQVNELYRKLFPECYFHAVSEAMKRRVLRYGVSEDHVKVIYSFVPQSFFDAYDAARSEKEQPLRVLSIGRCHWIKGYWYAIEAIKLLRAKGINVHYTMVLQGGPTQEILYQIEDRDLKDHVTILDGIRHFEVINLMKQHDVLLLSSVEEGIANVVLEAMALGLPVISTNCGGMREIVMDGETGWLVPIRNPLAISDALERFMHLSDADVLVVRRKAHQLVKAKCSANANSDTFADWYASIVCGNQ